VHFKCFMISLTGNDSPWRHRAIECKITPCFSPNLK
jgi:hypothetical protein